MIPVEQALDIILEQVRPLSPVQRELSHCLDFVLASDIVAKEPIPSFTNSAMDGYAVRSDDLMSGKNVLRVIDDLPAGTVPKRALDSGTTAKIMTGAPVPDGADAVVPVEYTETLADGLIKIVKSVEKNQHLRFRGEEIQSGETVLKKGTLLKPPHLGLLASLGESRITVIPKPKIAVITTGTEVIDPSQTPQPGQIRNSNLIAITSSVIQSGGYVVESKHVPDDPVLLEQTLLSTEAEVFITCGGVSVGEYDFVKTVLSKLGKIFFWKVAIKPGKPFVFGAIGTSWVFGLPGNPVSSLIAFEVLVHPALDRLAGHAQKPMTTIRARLLRAVPHKPERREYVRVLAVQKNGEWTAEPLPWQGSGMLRSLTEANALLVIPEDSLGYQAGMTVSLLLL